MAKRAASGLPELKKQARAKSWDGTEFTRNF